MTIGATGSDRAAGRRGRPSCPAGVPVALAAALLLAVPACVELVGQRIAWFHDQERDELTVLLFYDGIHDSHGDDPPPVGRRGSEQIAPFVAGGDLMVLDWWGTVSPAEMRKLAAKEGAPPAQRALAGLLLTLRTEVLGWYREPDGQIGAAQLVTVPGVGALLAACNRAIDANLLEDDLPDDAPATLRAMRAAAETGHAWLALDGHALVVDLPVHPDEWARGRWIVLHALHRAVSGDDGAADAAEVKVGDGSAAEWLSALASLAGGAPVSLIDGGDHVRLVLGRRDEPLLLRAWLHRDYEPSLEEAVVAAVPAPLSERLAPLALGGRVPEPDPVAAQVLAWGPPEETVRTLLDQLEVPFARLVAPSRLEDFARRWNAAGRLPEAPEHAAGTAWDRAAWVEWYAQVRRPRPAPADEPVAPGETG